MDELAIFSNVVSDAAGTEEVGYNISYNYRQSGPYKMAQLLQMAESGQVTKDYWICPVGASEWFPVTTINELETIIGKEQEEADHSVPQSAPRQPPTPVSPADQGKNGESMITCPRCGTQLEDDFLYCEECGALLKANGSDTEHKEKLENLNKQLAETTDKNAKNNFEIERLKEDLKAKDEKINNYINQIDTGKKSVEKMKKQRSGIIVGGIIALVVSIVVGVSSYSGLTQETTNERGNLQRQISSLTSINSILQAEVEELKQRAAADIKISAISIGNITHSYEIIDNYGATLYANKIRYLTTRITYDSRITGNETFYIKIIDPSGTLISVSDYSPKGFTYGWRVYVGKGINEVILGGWNWGTNSGGAYIPGTYTVEVWHKDLRLGSTSVTLH
jgi:regulator of replication initiation timing